MVTRSDLVKWLRRGEGIDHESVADAILEGGGGGGLEQVLNESGGTETFVRDETYGAQAFGYVAATAGSTGSIESTARGSVAFGRVYANQNTTGYIRASNSGATAFGYVTGGGVIQSAGPGSFAFGKAYASAGAAQIIAGGGGAFAGGYAYGDGSTGEILANSSGSFAFGYAENGTTITANARGCGQFGMGVNAVAHSFAVGTGLRFRGPIADDPPSLRNGDMWVDTSGNVMVRTGGVSKSLSGLA